MTLVKFIPQTRYLEFLGLAQTSVGYCHIDNGCRIVASGLHGSNGIARAQNGTVYVGSSKSGQIRVFEEQNDQSLVLTDVIALGTSMKFCVAWDPMTFFEHRSYRGQSLNRYKRCIMGCRTFCRISVARCVS